MARYTVANTGRWCQFQSIFRIKLVQCKLPVYILGILSILRIVIWNRTAKQVTLNTSNPWMSGIEVHGVWQGTSEDIQGRMERSNLYQKRLGSVDEKESIICRLEQMTRIECNIYQISMQLRVYRKVAYLQEPYSILLNLSEDELYLSVLLQYTQVLPECRLY